MSKPMEACNYDGELTLITKGYLDSLRPDVAEIMIHDPHSVVYRNCSIPADDMRRLMEEVVLSENPRVRIRFCAAYKFHTSGYVSAIGGYDYPGEYGGYMPNPHIDRYLDMGCYTPVVNQELRDGNYPNALNQLIVCGNTLNWSDAIVVETFFKILNDCHSDKKRCFELPDGAVVDPAGAAAWLKAQDCQAIAEGISDE